ncbi:hypothetical protein DPEC_G00226670 [Dallia pectoralis]|uniref:Uncharacterized protein n=1 Tax=Dallia pectoralis TaxID=75939 RepID=A0ACC2G110_DALPE|nr:hypothetical protein DPEC_G00226670 [Dallia pectoralis]
MFSFHVRLAQLQLSPRTPALAPCSPYPASSICPPPEGEFRRGSPPGISQMVPKLHLHYPSWLSASPSSSGQHFLSTPQHFTMTGYFSNTSAADSSLGAQSRLWTAYLPQHHLPAHCGTRD